MRLNIDVSPLSIFMQRLYPLLISFRINLISFADVSLFSLSLNDTLQKKLANWAHNKKSFKLQTKIPKRKINNIDKRKKGRNCNKRRKKKTNSKLIFSLYFISSFCLVFIASLPTPAPVVYIFTCPSLSLQSLFLSIPPSFPLSSSSSPALFLASWQSFTADDSVCSLSTLDSLKSVDI